MKRDLAIWTGVAVVAAMLVATLWSLRPGSRGRIPGAPTQGTDKATIGSTAMEAFVESARTPVVVAPIEETRPPPPPAARTDPRRDWLRGTVGNASGAPISAARVVVLCSPSSDNTLLWQVDHEFRDRLEPAGETRTDADGRFRLELARGIPFDLEVTAAGHPDGFAPLCYSGEDVLVTLGADHEVSGQLTRASDGGAIEGALLRVLAYPSFATRETRSDAEGRYRLSFPFPVPRTSRCCRASRKPRSGGGSSSMTMGRRAWTSSSPTARRWSDE